VKNDARDHLAPTEGDAGAAEKEGKMCLSTVYMDTGDEQQEIMKDVARVEAEGKGFWLINLFGERTFIEGKIQTVNLMDGSFITLNKEESGMLLSV
jgi:predicted RNA-binding protein